MQVTSIDEALKSGISDLFRPDSSGIADACTTDVRTGAFTVRNESQWTIEIMFVHLKSIKVENLPSGYSRDTGVFVAATNVRPHETSSPVDSCRVGGRNKPICADWIEIGYKAFIIYDGKRYERDIKLPSRAARPGACWRGEIPFVLRGGSAAVASANIGDKPVLPELDIGVEGETFLNSP